MTVHVPTRLIRVMRFDGRSLYYFDNQDPTNHGCLPLADAYYAVARQLRSHALCRITVLDGVIIALDVMPTRVP